MAGPGSSRAMVTVTVQTWGCLSCVTSQAPASKPLWAGHPGSSPDAPDGLGMPKPVAQLPCRLPSPLAQLHQPGGSGMAKFSPSAILQLMKSLIECKLCLQWAKIWKRSQSARLGSAKHLEALGWWLLCVWGSSSSTDMVIKLMRAEIGVL